MKRQLLIFVLIFLPMVVSADDSGSCGDNVTWTYVEATRTLIISGSGKMKDFFPVSAPWSRYKTSIQTVISVC